MRHARTIVVLLGLAIVAASAGCAREAYSHDASQPATPGLPARALNSVTRWTDRLEVLAVYGPFVAGFQTFVTVHVTDLRTFEPLSEGRLSLELLASGMAPVNGRRDRPSEPGEFPIAVTVSAPARYRARLTIDAPGVKETLDLGEFVALPSLDAATRAIPPTPPGVVTFGKVAQWQRRLATEVAAEHSVRSSLRVPATVRPAAGAEAVVAAPSAGRFSGVVPALGSIVSEGQPLGQLEPRLDTLDDVTTLEAEVTRKRLLVVEARNELARTDLLVAARAVPARQLETARHELDAVRGELRAAESRLESRLQTLAEGGSAAGRNAFILHAPIAGTLAAVDATPGATYEAGAALFRIVRTDPAIVEVRIPETDAAALAQVDGASLELGTGEPAVPLDVRSVRHAGFIDATLHALPVWLEVSNRSRRLLIGQTATAIVFTGGEHRALAVPASAVLTEGTRPVVFVQVGGESFERRIVETGARDGDRVAIPSGLRAGERVVTRGAYDVLLAASLPAAGDGRAQ